MNIPLGFEVGTGRKVEIPLGHQVVTGQTQESGKTTTQEALIVRSGKRAVAFLTKRGEESFRIAHMIPPYFQQEISWQFVSSVLEATFGEKLKFHRSSIMETCRANAGRKGNWPTPKTLADVRTNVQIALQKARGFPESILTELEEFLKVVVPQIEKLPYTTELLLVPGLNVMDLVKYSKEVQGMVIRSVLRHLHEKESDVVCIIPECWKFIPQKHNSPVKDAAESYIREGGVLKNYLWLDSQDIAGFSPEIKRQIKVWILGVQREKHEVERTLDHIPADVHKPKVADIMRLGKGEFFVAHGNTLVRVYVQPAWMNSELHAQAIAKGDEKVETARDILKEWECKDAGLRRSAPALQQVQQLEQTPPEDSAAEPQPGTNILRESQFEHFGENEDAMYKEKFEESQREVLRLGILVQKLESELGELKGTHKFVGGDKAKPPLVEYSPTGEPLRIVEVSEDVYQAIVKRLRSEAPALVKLLAESPALEVTVQRPVVQVNGTAEIYGKCVALAGDGFFKTVRTVQEIIKELARRWAVSPKTPLMRVTIPMDKLTEMGIFFRDGESYVLNPAAKVTVKSA